MSLLSDQQKSDEERKVRRKKCPFLSRTHAEEAVYVYFVSEFCYSYFKLFVHLYLETNSVQRQKQTSKQTKTQTNKHDFILFRSK